MNFARNTTSSRLFLAILFSFLTVGGSASVAIGDLLDAPKSVKSQLDNLPGRVGKTGPIKTVPDAKALDELFDSLTEGATTINSGTYPGIVKQLPDGTIIRKRPGSKSGGATIDITMPDGTIIKVHLP